MKTYLLRGLLLTTCVFMTFNANAAWRCKSHNFKGDAWYGFGRTQGIASNRALNMCVGSAKFPRNCKIEACQPITVWQCNAANNRGQRFAGLGYTKRGAMHKTMSLCSSGSANAYNCHVTGCFTR